MSADLIARLRALDAAATPGPWAYRPDGYDDWGIVKSAAMPFDGFEKPLRCVLAQFRHPEALDEEVLNAHRRAKTDPWQGNAELVTFLRNVVPEILVALVQLETLRDALEPFAAFAATFVDDEGWKHPPMKERIVDWFGPSDFRNAAATYRATFPETTP